MFEKCYLGLLLRDAALAILGVGVPLDDPHVSLIKLEHLVNNISQDSKTYTEIGRTYLLGAPLVDDVSCVLGLVAIFPRQINHELVCVLIFAGIELSNMLFPASRWGLPGSVLGGLGLLRVEGVVAVLPRPFVAACLGSARV